LFFENNVDVALLTGESESSKRVDDFVGSVIGRKRMEGRKVERFEGWTSTFEIRGDSIDSLIARVPPCTTAMSVRDEDEKMENWVSFTLWNFPFLSFFPG